MRRIRQRYRDYFFSGEWHIHTNFTDGKNSVCEYAERAVELGIPLLAFTEHVRVELEYDFGELLDEIEKAREKFPQLEILSGCEAKVLPDGTLDCSKEILERSDWRLFAFHTFPASIEKYLFAIDKVVNEYPVDAWAHPGLFFKKHTNLALSGDQLRQIFEGLVKNAVLLEVNLRYGLPESGWLEKYLTIAGDEAVIFGGDIHSVDELGLSLTTKENWRSSSPFWPLP